MGKRRQAEEEEYQRGLNQTWVKPQPKSTGQAPPSWYSSSPVQATDGDSDAESVLSFNININLDDLRNLHVDDETEEAEVWIINDGVRQEPAKASAETEVELPAAGTVSDPPQKPA